MLVFHSLSYVQLYYCHLINSLKLITLFVLFHSPVLGFKQKLVEKVTVMLCAMELTTHQNFMLTTINYHLSIIHRDVKKELLMFSFKASQLKEINLQIIFHKRYQQTSIDFFKFKFYNNAKSLWLS